MGMDEKKVGLLVLAAMLVSLAGMIVFGVGANENSWYLIIFSFALAFSVVFFGDWFGGEGKDA